MMASMEALMDWLASSEVFASSSSVETCLFMLEGEEVAVWGERDVATVVELCPNLSAFVKRMESKKKQPVLRVKKVHTEKLVNRLLFDKAHRVVVFEHVTRKWERRCSGTAADVSQLTHFWPNLRDHVSVDVIMALHLSKCSGTGNKMNVGVFAINKACNTITLASFIDNLNMDTLQSILLQLNPSECYMNHPMLDDTNDFHAKSLKQAMTNTLVKTAMPKMKTGDAKSILKAMKNNIQLEQFDVNALEADHKMAIVAGALLLDEVMAWEGDPFKIEFVSPSEYMCLSHSTLEGLDVFSADSTLSLYKLLNRTRTAMGDRLLTTWMRQPLKSSKLIWQRQEMVQSLVQNESIRKILYDEHLRRMGADLERLALKVSRRKTGLLDLFKAYCTLIQLEKTLQLLQGIDCQPLSETVIKPLVNLRKKWSRYVQMIEETIDLDSINHQQQPRIKPSFDEGLQQLAHQLDELTKEMDNVLVKDARELKLDEKSLKLESTAQHGYHYRVTLNNERILRREKSNRNLVYIDSNKSGVKFRTLKLNVLAERHQKLSEQYGEKQQSVIEEVLTVVQTYCKTFIAVGGKIARIDCLVALATAAIMAPIPFVRPELNDEGVLEMRQVRHPTVETMDGVNFIPNDLDFKRDDKEFLIITGPNMGGKSTYMRSVALTVLMTQIGSFVPCASANVCPVDNILVRIGASDCQKEGLSTFMVEMLDAARILRCATKSSLVLIDELGRGTSTSDGFGLAWAISEHLSTDVRCFSLFATHFFEMTDLAKQVNTVHNVFCDALSQGDDFVLLYTIKEGVCKKSFGIEVARIAGFPDEVVKDAQKYLEQAEEDEERALKLRKIDV